MHRKTIFQVSMYPDNSYCDADSVDRILEASSAGIPFQQPIATRAVWPSPCQRRRPGRQYSAMATDVFVDWNWPFRQLAAPTS